jgi:hypothetical protein
MCNTIMAVHTMFCNERGGGCVKCGDLNAERLQWVHVRGWQDFPLRGMNLLKPINQVRKELEKCDLVCVSCKG